MAALSPSPDLMTTLTYQVSCVQVQTTLIKSDLPRCRPTCLFYLLFRNNQIEVEVILNSVTKVESLWELLKIHPSDHPQ